MNQSPIFIGGAGRSGTTLLRVILDSHSNIACGPEFKAIPLIMDLWAELQTGLAPTMQEYQLGTDDINWLFGEMITSLLTPYLLNSNKQRIAEKTPNNIFFFQHLHHIFSDSPLIHVIRDGRDVVTSLLSMTWTNGQGTPLGITQDAKQAAEYWVSTVEAGRSAGKRPAIEPYYLEVKYEDIVLTPEETLKKVFQHIDEPWEANVMDFYNKHHDLAAESSAAQVQQKIYSSSIGRWKTDLNSENQGIIASITEPLLEELGYC